MGNNAKPIILNLGCGFTKSEGMVNVDAFSNCEPDVVHDLNTFPYPWEDNSVDGVHMHHVLEHLDDWWGAFNECARIIKPGGFVHIRVPDESSRSALTYRDHKHVFTELSFFGVQGYLHGANAWAMTEYEKVPLRLVECHRVPHKEYFWMTKWCPGLLAFCANHLRNFIHEQQFHFIKIG